METKYTFFDGMMLETPNIAIEWPSPTLDDFPTFCGPGRLGDFFIPDSILDLKISPACYIHDLMWDFF